MIHYSSIKDAWGKKNTFKNDAEQGKFPNTYESAIHSQAMCKQQNVPTIAPEKFEQTAPGKFEQIETIKYEIPQHQSPETSHEQNNCAFMEHLENCPFCMNKIREHFSETTTDDPISTINIFNLKINITKDVLKILFIIILIVILILVMRMVNVSFKKENISHADLLKLITQIKYFNPMISQL